MKYYLLIIHDPYKNVCNSIYDSILNNILKSATNGWCRLLNDSFIIKSTQQIKYWQDLIYSMIEKDRQSYFLTEILLNNKAGYIGESIWKWINAELKETEKTLCKNTFEVESCS